jgi:hypothetical protein
MDSPYDTETISDTESETGSDYTSEDSDIIMQQSGDEESEYSDGDIFLTSPFDDSYDHIYEQDEEHVLSDKMHNTYYIGKCYKFQENIEDTYSNEHIFLSISVSPTTFFRHSYLDITNYLNVFGSFNCFNYYNNIFNRNRNQGTDIMKAIVIEDHNNYKLYTVVLKTHWIRLIQRHWRKIYKQQSYIIRQRCKIQNMRYREIHGYYPKHINRLPLLNGMLNCYLKKYL